MTSNNSLAGLKGATEHLTKDTPQDEAKVILKNAKVYLLDLSFTDLEDALEMLEGKSSVSKGWWKAFVKEVNENRKTAKQKPQTDVLLEQLEDVRRLHTAIDFPDKHIVIGFRVDLPEGGEGTLLVISDGKQVTTQIHHPPSRGETSADKDIELGGQDHALRPRSTPPRLQDVWSLKGVKTIVDNPIQQDEPYELIKTTLRRFLDIPEPVYGLLAAWTVMTYFAHIFSAVPYLHFIGEKETGKSKTLEALRFSCFNAWKGRDISAAALGDTVDGARGVVLIDQAEYLDRREDGSSKLIGLLADSYKKAGGERCIIEMSQSGRTTLRFSPYGPKAFASTKRLDEDLEDRVVRIPMTRTRKPLPDLEGYEPEWDDIRNACYQFALLFFSAVGETYKSMRGDGTRVTELWRPLGAVMSALDVNKEEVDTLKEYYMAQSAHTRHEPTGWKLLFLETIQARAEEARENEEFSMTVQEILTAMGFADDEVKKPGPKWVGDILATYSLSHKRTRPRVDGKKVLTYHFAPDQAIDICSRYLRPEEESDIFLFPTPPRKVVSSCTSGDNLKDINNLSGTRQGGHDFGGHDPSCPGTRQVMSQSGHVQGHVQGKCPDITKESGAGTRGHDFLGGTPNKKNNTLFWEDDDDDLWSGKSPNAGVKSSPQGERDD